MDPSATGFSLHNASFLVSVVEVAGQNDEHRIEEQLASVGFVSAELIKDKELHCVVAEHGSYLVLAFRGSTTMQDWLTDLKFTQAKTKKTGLPGRVHRGFFLALDQGWPQIADLLHRADGNGKSIWITGHSLGGGLAHVAAMRAVDEGIRVAGIYTFASPRVGDGEFVAAFEKVYRGRSFRVVDANDLVPHVPPSQPAEKQFARIVAPTGNKVEYVLAVKGAFMLVKYSHAGELWVFDENGNFSGRKTYSDDADVGYWRQVEADYGSGSWVRVVNDQGDIARKHFLAAYVKILHRAAGFHEPPG
jgi:triacylglycerol lipase